MNTAVFFRRVNGTLTIVWLLLVIPTVLFWRESIFWLALMSIWANIASHFAAWIAGRTEVKQDEAN